MCCTNNDSIHNRRRKARIQQIPSIKPAAKNATKGEPVPTRVPSVSSKKYLRITNLPSQAADQPQELMDFLNQAMRTSNLCYFDETPIRNCLIHNGTAYIGLCSPRMAREALGLDGLSYFGRRLQVQVAGNQQTSTTPELSNSSPTMEENAWLSHVQHKMDKMRDSLHRASTQLEEMEVCTSNDEKSKRIKVLRDAELAVLRASANL